MDEQALLADEARYCSHGDTVHYSNPPKIFSRCEGSYLFDGAGTPFLDLQMWYSAVNFGYANPRLSGALKAQVDALPQLASQYLHESRQAHRAALRESVRRAGSRAFNVGGFAIGRGRIEAGAQCQQRQEPDVRLRGWGTTAARWALRPSPPATVIAAAMGISGERRAVRAFPVLLPLPVRQEARGLRPVLRGPVRAAVRYRIRRRV